MAKASGKLTAKMPKDILTRSSLEKTSSNEANVVDQDGYQVVKESRPLGNYMPAGNDRR
jgi:hypothetical protein